MKSDALFSAIVDKVESGIYSVDRNRFIKTWNKAAEDISGYGCEEVVGRRCQDNILCHIDSNGMPLCTAECPLYATMDDGEERTAEVMLRHRDGRRIPVSVKTIPAYENGEIVGGIEVFSKIGELNYGDSFVAVLTDMAVNDHLTGVPNRALLQNQLIYRTKESSRLNNNSFCAALVGLDNFRAFSEYYKIETAETVLRLVSANLAQAVGMGNTVGRWNENTFLAIINIDSASGGLLALAERLRKAVANTKIMFKGMRIAVTASVGLAVVNKNDTADSLVSRADNMLLKSKQRGKNCSTVDCTDFSAKQIYE